jgi:hypothetical protein
MAGAYGVHRTWALTIRSIWLTKSLYVFFGCSTTQTYRKEQEKLSEKCEESRKGRSLHSGGTTENPWWGGPLGRCRRLAARTPRGRPWTDWCRTAHGSTSTAGEGTPRGSPPTRRPRHCRTQPLVGSCQNSAAPADLGHLLEGCVGDPLSPGDHAPLHGVSRWFAEQHPPEQLEQVDLQKPVWRLVVGIVRHVVSLHTHKCPSSHSF